MDDDKEKGSRQDQRDPIDDAAATKLWTVYVSEAEKYDKALVESWRSDMNGMLIFAGLFSAILTAFLIESYQTLLPDSGDDTAFFLRQISDQLAASASGTNFTVSQPVPHVPTTTSLICNILWFISLGLSLACALIATLIEQWAREFIHRSEMRSAPLIRARIFSFLYFGLKRFKMHMVVEVIPLLLHASLILFFAGLVAFLVPVNISVMAVVAVLLVIVIAVYSLLTLLPLKHLDSPYHTPLSAGLWNLVGCISRLLRLRHASVVDGADGDDPHTATMVEAMSRNATTRSPERVVRDNRALVWTITSLSDETELEPFVEGIADVLCGLAGRRRGYEHHIQHLLDTPELRFRTRIEDLLATCDSGLLLSVAKTRRQTACYRALWSIADMSIQELHEDTATYLPILFERKAPIDYVHEVDHYGASAWAFMRSSATLALLPSLSVISADLLKCQAELGIHGVTNLDHLLLHREQLHANKLFQFFLDPAQLFRYRDRTTTGTFLIQCIDDVQRFTSSIGHAILFRYLWAAARLEHPPYEFGHTQLKIPIMDIEKTPVSATSVLHAAIKATIITNLQKLNESDSSGDHWVDQILVTLLSFYTPPLGNERRDSFCEVAMYLGQRTSLAAIASVVQRCATIKDICSMMLKCCTAPQDRLWDLFGGGGYAAAADSLTALWRICSLNPIDTPNDSSPFLTR
ncbi:hypothetical protein C8J57DRAFT_64302 [Mycena rebaudengoi]|nr:hypothetical protein C8J57DRAFT_64302 [Mycena rebaudengoi]